jgi:hypothetical protein
MGKIQIPVQGTDAELRTAQEYIDNTVADLTTMGVIITPTILYKLLQKVKNNPILIKLL